MKTRIMHVLKITFLQRRMSVVVFIQAVYMYYCYVVYNTDLTIRNSVFAHPAILSYVSNDVLRELARIFYVCLHIFVICVSLTDLLSVAIDHKPNFVISIEGNISSGKSTFCNAVCLLNYVKVVFEKVNRRLLKSFLSNPKQYALAMQSVRVSRRLQELELLSHYKNPHKNVILLDRSVLGDFAFVNKQFLDLNMNIEDMCSYNEELELNNFVNMLQHKNLDAMLYLHSSPKLCRERVEKRGDVDSVTKQDYLNDIDDLHFYGVLFLIVHGLVPVFVADSKSLYSPDESERVRRTQSLFESIVFKKRKQSAAYFVTSFEQVPQVQNSDYVVIPWNLPHDLEVIPDGHLPRLKREWRYRHTQTWKDNVIDAFTSGQVIYFQKYGNLLTLYDLYCALSVSFDSYIHM